jgi:GNAT superfamily N-acetyltransferase
MIANNELSKLNEANLWDFCMEMGAYGEVYRGPELKWIYTGGAAFNRVVDICLSPDQADARIDSIIEMFRSRGVEAAWLTGPSTTPADMDARLKSRGLHFVPWIGMGVDVRDLVTGVEMPSGLEIIEVVDAELIAPWADVICRGFGWVESIHEPFRQLNEKLGVCNAIPWHHYLGFLDGRAASACTIYEGSGILGVYLVAVAPEARRRGLGFATTWYALNEARGMGYGPTILQASPMGKGVYEKLGFTAHCDMGLYLPFAPAG